MPSQNVEIGVETGKAPKYIIHLSIKVQLSDL